MKSFEAQVKYNQWVSVMNMHVIKKQYSVAEKARGDSQTRV